MRFKRRCHACDLESCRFASVSPVICYFMTEYFKLEADEQTGVSQRHWLDNDWEEEEIPYHDWMSTSIEPQSADPSVSAQKLSPLLFLPVEIFHDVVGRLSDIDVFSVRLSCRHFYTLLSDRKPPSTIDQHTVLDLKNMLLRESFQRGCDFERAGELRNSIAMCSLCQQSHSRKAFTVEELARPPESRVCYCKTGAIQLCAHSAYSFTKLRSLPLLTVRNSKFRASMPAWCSQCLDEPSKYQGVPRIHRSQEGYCIRWSLEIPCGAITEATLGDFTNLIAEVGGSLCPHLQPQSVWHHLAIGSNMSREISVVSENKEMRCVSSDCSTKVSWLRKGFGPMELKVSRYFCIERPDDPSYLAQLVVSKAS